jgi:hypothetical protein
LTSFLTSHLKAPFFTPKFTPLPSLQTLHLPRLRRDSDPQNFKVFKYQDYVEDKQPEMWERGWWSSSLPISFLNQRLLMGLIVRTSFRDKSKLHYKYQPSAYLASLT